MNRLLRNTASNNKNTAQSNAAPYSFFQCSAGYQHNKRKHQKIISVLHLDYRISAYVSGKREINRHKLPPFPENERISRHSAYYYHDRLSGAAHNILRNPRMSPVKRPCIRISPVLESRLSKHHRHKLPRLIEPFL